MSEEAEVIETTEEATEDTSLLESTTELGEGEYFLTEGIKGAGDRPEWYQEKFTSVAEQAKSYSELEKQFGAFTGQPKDGYTLADDIDKDDALVVAMTEFAKDINMNQDGFNKGLELLLAQGEAVHEANEESEMALLGDNAEGRLKTIEGFMRNNMSVEDYEQHRGAVNSASVVMLVESLIKSTAPKKLPIDGGESPTGITLKDIEAEMYKKNEDGQLLRSIDREHESKIQRMLKEYGGEQPNIVTVS
ncbi:MAG: hypothetical protein GY829_12475 [Gammaproteobacteria bacterium]|nr:hypothetical protein [Gammaproteobacteria bacterium]